MSEKSDQMGDGPVQTQPDESNRAGEESLQKQHDGAPNDATEADKIGPGHPPRKTRWKKGGPSPNPRGRPRKEQSLAPDLKNALTAALNRKVRVSRGEKQVLMTRAEAGIEQLLNQFAKGDRYARRDLMAYADKLGIDFLAQFKQTIEDALPSNLQAILDSYVARRSSSGDVAPLAPVLASPELLDDDRAPPAATPTSRPVTKTEPILAVPANTAAPLPAASPLPAKAAPAPISVAPPRANETTPTPPALTKPQPARRPAPAPVAAQTAPTSPPPPDPEPKPGTIYPKPFSRMSKWERRAWYPEWWVLYLKWEIEQER